MSATACLDRERRVTTREDQPEAIVFDATVVGVRIVGAGQHRRLLLFGRAAGRAAQPVERAIARGRCEPGAGVARDAVTGPSVEGLREGILRAFLGEIPVAGRANECGDDASPITAERVGDRRFNAGRHISQIGRTSIVPVRAPGIFAATSIASSRFLQSTV